MSFALRCLTVVWLLHTFSPLTLGQDSGARRVLFLGNSVFYFKGGIYQTFEGFSEAAGLDYQAVSQRKKPNDPGGTEFLGLGRIPISLPGVAEDTRIHSLIRSGRFDYVVLEARRPGYLMPASVERPKELRLAESIPYEENLKALTSLHRTIVESGAQTVLYMHPGSKLLPYWKLPIAQIYEKLRIDLERVKINGRNHSVILVPARLLWVDGIQRYGVDAWYDDNHHGTPLARYAVSCMLFTYLSGKDPRQNPFRELPRPPTVSAETPRTEASLDDANWIKEQVWSYYETRP